MSFTGDWVKEHPKGIKFKCSCGSTVYLQGWIENSEFSSMKRFVLSAKCWNCDKQLTIQESTLLIDSAICSFIDNYIQKFIRDFNFDEKPKTIRVVK